MPKRSGAGRAGDARIDIFKNGSASRAGRDGTAALSTTPTVLGVFANSAHTFSKHAHASITLLEGLGVEGDAHCGVTVQHLYDIKKEPGRANLRQVHLMQAELFDEVNAKGFSVGPGDLGENITTRHLDLLGLPAGALLHLGATAVVKVTGLRNPCFQIDRFQKGLVQAVLERSRGGPLIRKTGVMSVVIAGGVVHPNDPIAVRLPEGEPLPLEPV
jgi:MOSC domain-containing protein YiiM